jgi:uncharacterized SAM-binding protein YcdF (DUF218 family)
LSSPWSRRRRRLLLAVVVLTSVCGLIICRVAILRGAARLLVDEDRAAATDYVLVLGGGEDTRPFMAAALVNVGLAKDVLLIRVALNPSVNEEFARPRHELSRRVLLMRGVPGASIHLLPETCNTTYDEAHSLGHFLDATPDVTVTVVTTDYHTRRARWAFRRVLGDRAARVRFLAAPAVGYSPENWWLSEEGTQAYLDELLKLGYYFLAYNPAFCVAFVLLGGAFAIIFRVRRRICRKKDSPAANQE